MPSPFYDKSTTFLLRMLRGDSNVHDIGTGFHALAEDVDALLAGKLLLFAKYSGAATLKAGELAFQEKPGESTFTLPAAPEVNQIIGVIAQSLATAKINGNGKLITGDFVNAEPTITLLGNQHVLLFYDGGVWRIIAGEPKREQTYGAPVERAINTPIEPSATRPTFVIVTATASTAHAYLEMGAFVGGKSVGNQRGSLFEGTSSIELTLSFIVPAGVSWQASAKATHEFAEVASKLFSIYLPL
jgi:hypothetical protein